MAGLLYKDFVSVKGKKLCLLIFLFTVIYMALRMAFPGSALTGGFMIYTAQGEEVHLMDAFFIFVPPLFLCFACFMINSFVAGIVEDDQKNKIMNYLNSMPVHKNTYVASKYIFPVIAAYVFYSVYTILSITCKAFCMEGPFFDFINAFDMISIIWIMIALLTAAIEFPLFICLGKEKALMIKVALILVIAMGIIGYLMFGDLQVIRNFNYEVFIRFIEKHQDEMMISQAVSPVVIGILYYISYRITCHFAKKGVA